MALTEKQRQELDTHIFGSGALSYPWYQYGTFVNYRLDEVNIVAEDPDGDFLYKTYAISFEDLVRAAQTLLDERKNIAVGDDGSYTRKGLTDLVNENWDECDIDADVADLIIQTAIYGEVVFA